MAASVKVCFELGHRAKIREVPTEEGHTHDWMVYVKGFEGISLGYFVEKVVFHLHDTYEQPKRVVKQPPYKVEESGFAGFIMPIDVYFRNREPPKTVTFHYDLFLHVKAMPPVNHTRLEKLTFTNPTEDFRKKLLDAGALLIKPPDGHSSEERSHVRPSSHSKKDRSKSKEHSKRREGSSHDDKKKSTVSISSKKEGQIAGKDIKRREEEFKQPKVPDLGKPSKESAHYNTQRERGRSEKQHPSSEIDSNKKTKKKHSSSSPHPQESQPKSLCIPSERSKKNLI